jgi:hypothetical protein
LDVNAGQKSLAALLLFHLYGLYTAEVGKRVQKQEEQVIICLVTERGRKGYNAACKVRDRRDNVIGSLLISDVFF